MRPDVLHAEPTPRGDLRPLQRALVFAFARAGGEDALACAASLNELAESRWRPDCFAADLFLEQLVEGCFRVTIDGQRIAIDRARLLQILAHPPADPTHVDFRQQIQRELVDRPLHRASLERVYLSLRTLRSALGDSDALRGRSASTQRRVEILQSVRAAIDTLASSFGGAESGLARLRAYGQQVATSSSYERLAQLLDFEDRRATLESRLQIGYDGTLRRFEIVRVSEAAHPAFASTSLGRWWRRLTSLLKGYRFSEDDVLSRLLDEIFGELEDVLLVLLPLMSELEFYLAALAFRDLCEQNGLSVCLPELDFRPPGVAERHVEGLFNPWLLAQREGPPVPCQIHQVPAHATVILTGPNSGGKTRLLQALAVTQVLGQVGFFVPARSARLAWSEGMFLSLLERVSPEQSEGRLGTELLRIRSVFESSPLGAVIILDELCSGTNPSEGEEIFQLVLSLFDELEPQVLISTHFLDFASRLEQRQEREHRPERPLAFLQVELDERELPTYQFVPGVAKTSLARRTAARLGVTREELLSLVERRRSSKAAPTSRPVPLPLSGDRSG
jgi:DNA mismatch repair protein MutS2